LTNVEWMWVAPKWAMLDGPEEGLPQLLGSRPSQEQEPSKSLCSNMSVMTWCSRCPDTSNHLDFIFCWIDLVVERCIIVSYVRVEAFIFEDTEDPLIDTRIEIPKIRYCMRGSWRSVDSCEQWEIFMLGSCRFIIES
jgi:hypothetical protein